MSDLDPIEQFGVELAMFINMYVERSPIVKEKRVETVGVIVACAAAIAHLSGAPKDDFMEIADTQWKNTVLQSVQHFKRDA